MKLNWFYCLLVLALIVSCKEKSSKVSNSPKVTVTNVNSLKWTDYHTGELPPVGYYLAFDSIIHRWGIKYERIEGGCEQMPYEKNRYEKHNEQYFHLLEKKFGKNWHQRFNDEVAALDLVFKKENTSGFQINN